MKKQELVRMLLDIYGTFELSPKQVAKIMNVSEQTLWRMRSRSIGPTYRQIGEAKNSTISYPLHELSGYILSQDLIITDSL